jgi:hypothetical protein
VYAASLCTHFGASTMSPLVRPFTNNATNDVTINLLADDVTRLEFSAGRHASLQLVGSSFRHRLVPPSRSHRQVSFYSCCVVAACFAIHFCVTRSPRLLVVLLGLRRLFAPLLVHPPRPRWYEVFTNSPTNDVTINLLGDNVIRLDFSTGRYISLQLVGPPI